MLSYLTRHWRGESSLAVAWWVNGVGITLLALGLERYAASLETAFGSRAGFGAYLALGLAVLLALPAWQVVGIFRAADRHAQQVGTILAGRFVQVLTTLLTVALAVRFLAYAGEAVAGARLAYRLGGSGYAVGVSEGGRVLEISGGFLFGLADDAQRLLEANPGVRRVRLNSGGGSLGEARRLRALIEARGLDTDSTSGCSSACISAYIAGKHRLLHRSARMGFHLPRNPGFGLHGRVGPDYMEELAYLERRGVPLWFRQRIVGTGRGFWYPTPAQLRESGFVQDFYGAPRAGEDFYYR